MIRRRWDSNPRYLSVSLVFKTSSLNHSDTSPYVFILFRSRKRLTYIITSICICQQLFSIFFIFLICFFNRRKVGKRLSIKCFVSLHPSYSTVTWICSKAHFIDSRLPHFSVCCKSYKSI